MPTVSTTDNRFHDLAYAIFGLESESQVRDFLADLLTSSECENVSARWQIMLELARVQAGLSTKNQRQIATDLGCAEKIVGNVKEHGFGRKSSGTASKSAINCVKRSFGTGSKQRQVKKPK